MYAFIWCLQFTPVDIFVVSSLTSSRSNAISPYPIPACVQVPVRKFLERLPTTCAYMKKNIDAPPFSVCAWYKLCPSQATGRPSISAPRAYMDAPYLHFHSLIAFKDVSCSWSLVLICDRIAMERFQLELELQAGTCSHHALYMYEYKWYVDVPGLPVPYI